MGAKYSKRTMEISSTPVKPGAPDANGKVADDVTVEKVEDKVTTNGETKAVEETNGSAKKEGDKAEEEKDVEAEMMPPPPPSSSLPLPNSSPGVHSNHSSHSGDMQSPPFHIQHPQINVRQ